MRGACGGGGGGASSMKDDGWGDRLRRTRIFFYSTVDAPPPPPLLAVKPAPGRETYGKKMEGVYQKLRNLDAYPKINEDFYSRTLSGGLITLISSTLMLFLFFSEFST
ncbi:hypothetical protein OIU77_028706 [Salix suchowensis]|uniref:Endoplasmic reticulum vesicle transporter N-terminal domain-containing protein n=1 Tax=Salix suchowensis TaxID=1278906 RepID=A0ABQ9BM24_9ROSI|nr:hypothetical protein OIU77_028706 [Salix suchowensis]